MSASLRARLAKLEAELKKQKQAHKEWTPAEVIREVLFKLHGAMYEVDQEAIENGRPGEFFQGMQEAPGGIVKLAERGNRLAQLALKMRDFFETFLDDPDLVVASAAGHLLYGMRPMEQQAKE